MCGLVLGDVRAMFFSIPKRCRHALSPLRHLYGVASGLVGNRKPTLAAHLTTTTAHHRMAPRTTQAGATSGALDTHRLTLGDRRHVDYDIRDSLVIVILSQSINYTDSATRPPADLEAPQHASQSPEGAVKTTYTLMGLFREVRNRIYIGTPSMSTVTATIRKCKGVADSLTERFPAGSARV